MHSTGDVVTGILTSPGVQNKILPIGGIEPVQELTYTLVVVLYK